MLVTAVATTPATTRVCVIAAPPTAMRLAVIAAPPATFGMSHPALPSTVRAVAGLAATCTSAHASEQPLCLVGVATAMVWVRSRWVGHGSRSRWT